MVDSERLISFRVALFRLSEGDHILMFEARVRRNWQNMRAYKPDWLPRIVWTKGSTPTHVGGHSASPREPSGQAE